MRCRPLNLILATAVSLYSCSSGGQQKQKGVADKIVTQDQQNVNLPAPYATKSSVKYSHVIGWPESKTPVAPAGFTVTKFAADFDNPRWIYIGPNGDIFVAESSTETKGVTKKVRNTVSGKSSSEQTNGSANRITLLRDTNNDGIPDLRTTFLENLNQPFGMLILNNSFYVGNTDGLVQYPYTTSDTSIRVAGKKIVDLPAGGYNNHWTRNIMASKDGKSIFIAVGSGSNVGEHGMENEVRRANILQVRPDGSGERVYASGIRNGQGMGFAPGTNTLWVSVNERDELGDELVPDYFTSVQEGGFYGWPYSYWGNHPDPRLEGKGADMAAKAIPPDVSLGAHTASLGLAFDEKNIFPNEWKGGAFIGQHGSWNRSSFSGYQVAFVPFKSGKPAGPVKPFLTGFLVGGDSKDAYGRPVGIAFTKNAMLVADDAGNTIWRIVPNRQ